MFETIMAVLGAIVISYILTVVVVDVINQYLSIKDLEDDQEL